MADLARTAAALRRRAASRSPGPRKASPALPPLLFFTDPKRTPDPVSIAERLPRGSGIVYRAFGARDAVAVGRRLAAVARRRGLVLLVGADPELAAAVGAHGLHLPERLGRQVRRLRRPGWIVTVAAHSLAAARAASGADAVVVSPVFLSDSPSAGRPLGPTRFAALVRAAGRPVYGLGGITPRTARRLAGSGAVGLAAVEAFRT